MKKKVLVAKQSFLLVNLKGSSVNAFIKQEQLNNFAYWKKTKFLFAIPVLSQSHLFKHTLFSTVH